MFFPVVDMCYGDSFSLFTQRTETNARGWYDDELTKQTKDWKEGFDLGHVPDPDKPPDHPSNVVVEGYNQWPNESVPFFKVRTRTLDGDGRWRGTGNEPTLTIAWQQHTNFPFNTFVWCVCFPNRGCGSLAIREAPT